MLAAILTTLQTDTILEGLLPGSVFDAGAVTVISKPTTPGAFDEHGEVRPCALVQMNRLEPIPGLRVAESLSLSIYFYQRSGTASIEPARIRVHSLLNRQRIAGAGQRIWEIQHDEDLLSAYDAGLRASLIVSRYRVPLRGA